MKTFLIRYRPHLALGLLTTSLVVSFWGCASPGMGGWGAGGWGAEGADPSTPNGGGTGGTSNANGGKAGTGGNQTMGGKSGSGGMEANSGGAAAGEAAAGGDAAAGEAAAGGGAAGASGTIDVAGQAGAGGSGEPAALDGKVIFLTSMPKKSTFGGVSGADVLCNASPPVAGTYRALLVDGTNRVACSSANCMTGGATEGVNWALQPNTKYVRDDQQHTLIGTTTSAAIFELPLDASIGTDAYSYWTGLDADWTTSTDDCNGWTETSGVYANEGLADAIDSQAIVGVNESCATLAGAFIACVQQ